MSREITSKRLAVERLAEHMTEHVIALPVTGGYEIHILSDDAEEEPMRRKAIDALAFLTDLALRVFTPEKFKEIREEVNWHGNVPLDGLPGYKEDALSMLRYGTKINPNKPLDRIGPRTR